MLPVIEHGQAQLIDGALAVDDGLLIEPAPGHTVGHVILKLTTAATAPCSAAMPCTIRSRSMRRT